MIKLKPEYLRWSVSKLLDMLGDENGIIYYDGVPLLKIRRYDVTQAKSVVPHVQGNTPYDVTQATTDIKHDVTHRYKPPQPGEVVVIRGKVVKVPNVDADGNIIPWD